MQVIDPGGLGFQVTQIWAFLAVHDDGDEGVMAFKAPDGAWMPMIAADPDRLESLTEIALRMAEESDRKVVLARFTERTDVMTIGGD